MFSLAMTDTHTIENDLLFLIYDVAQLMRRHADRRARQRGMTRAQWAVLARLERQPGITQNELAHLTDVEPITVGRLIDRLEQSGFVERKADPKDRRIWRLYLTPKCAAELAEIKDFRRELHAEMAECVDGDTIRAVVRGLKSMRTNLSVSNSNTKKGAAR